MSSSEEVTESTILNNDNLHGFNNFLFPPEVLLSIFQYLSSSDLVTARQVCNFWYQVGNDSSLCKHDRIVWHNDITYPLRILMVNKPEFANFTLLDSTVDFNVAQERFWKHYASLFEQLMFINCSMSEGFLHKLLPMCEHLRVCHLNDCSNVFMSGRNIIDAEKPYQLLHLTELSITNNRYLSDELFCQFMEITPNLQSLTLRGSQIQYHTAIHKRFYPNGDLSKPSTNVLTFAVIQEWLKKRAITLKSICLSETRIDNTSLSCIAEVPGLHLKKLLLVGCNDLRFPGYEALCNAQCDLEELDVSMSVHLNDACVTLFCRALQKLKKLSVAHCPSVSTFLLSLVSQLEHLNISDTVVNNTVFTTVGDKCSAAGNHSKLTTLIAKSLKVIEDFQNFPDMFSQLKYLDMSGSAIDDILMQKICCHLKRLQGLKLSSVDKITDYGLTGHSHGPNNSKSLMGYPISSLQDLKVLELDGCFHVSDYSVVHAIRYLKLQHINLSKCAVTDEGLQALSLNSVIEKLVINRCGAITDQGIEAVTQNMSRLKHLDVQGCGKLTDHILQYIGDNCLVLQFLDVSHCTKMTYAGTLALQVNMPQLHTLNQIGIETDGNREKVKPKIPAPPSFMRKLPIFHRRAN